MPIRFIDLLHIRVEAERRGPVAVYTYLEGSRLGWVDIGVGCTSTLLLHAMGTDSLGIDLGMCILKLFHLTLYRFCSGVGYVNLIQHTTRICSPGGFSPPLPALPPVSGGGYIGVSLVS